MKSALITGAATGIGRASALRLDAEGWRVFAGIRRGEDDEVAALRVDASERLVPLLLDVTAAEQVAAAAAAVAKEVGDAGLDGLVNNAGISVLAPLETIAMEDFRRAIDVNLTGAMAVTQAMLPLIRKARGRIVFISSIGGRMTLPYGGPYSASKHGVEAVIDCLRQELRPWGIAVAGIEPGAVDTPIWEREERTAGEVAARASAAQEQLYGETLERFRTSVRKTAERGIPPEKVAAAVEDALTSRRPRSRYTVGLDARGQLLLRRLLPDRAFDRVIARALNV